MTTTENNNQKTEIKITQDNTGKVFFTDNKGNEIVINTADLDIDQTRVLLNGLGNTLSLIACYLYNKEFTKRAGY